MLVWCAALAALPLGAQPAIATGGIVNAASYAPVGMPNSAIAQGSIFLVFGQQLGPATLVSSSLPLATILAGTSAAVTVNGTTVAPLIVYTSAQQVAMIMPSSTPTGAGSMTVTYGGATSQPVAVQVTAASFGMFSVNQQGSGPAVVTDANYVPITLTHAAAAGQSLILWGTGLGKISGDETQTPPAGNVGSKPVVWVGSQQANVQYWGRSPSYAGLDQINFQVPSGTRGCYVSVAVQAGGVVSNFGSIAVASSGAVCSDPLGLSSSQLAPLQNGQNLSVALLAIGRSAVTVNAATTTTDSGSASFLRYTPAQLFGSSFGQTVSAGSCMVYPVKGNPLVSDPVQPQGLDAGASLSLGGTNGTVEIRATSTKGYYAGPLGSILNVSTHTLNGFGGSDVGPFAVELDAPTSLSWTNQAAISTVSESQGITVNWTGAGGSLTVTGYSFVPDQNGNAGVGARFYCAPSAGSGGSGQFAVPSYVLLSLPAAGGFLGITSTRSPSDGVAAIRGIDAGIAGASMQILKNVTYGQ
jgi:uncharacterized protein (TIGR03437 family)